MFDLSSVQAAVRQLGCDGWLLYDFRGLNVLARRVLGIASDAMLSRRWFYFIPDRVRQQGSVHEMEVQRQILDHFQANHLVADHAPICAVGPHSGDPHFEPAPGPAGTIREGDFVLIDLWGKLDRPRSVYSDL